MNKDENETPAGVQLAQALMGQIDEHKNPECGFWMASIVSKLLAENPRMSLREFQRMMNIFMPESVKAYQEYLKYT